MFQLLPLFACGSSRISPWIVALVFSVGGAWLLSLLLSVVNPFLISSLNTGTRSEATHWVFWAVYLISGFTIAAHGLRGMENTAWLYPIFGIPVMAISHFIVLLWTRKRTRRKQRLFEVHRDSHSEPPEYNCPRA